MRPCAPHRPRIVLAALVACVLAVTACLPATSRPSPTVVVGVGSTDEQRLLAALSIVALDRAGLAPEIRADLGSTVDLRREAIRGNIDLFWDYTGAAWALGLHQQTPPADPTESYERVRRADEERNLTWLEPAAANATLALFVRESQLPADEPATLSWLSRGLSGQRLCADRDFIRRPGGLADLARAYAFNVDDVELVAADEQQAIEQVADGSCYAGLATATSGAARRAGLVPVSDDLVVFPAFVVAPVARSRTLERAPEVAAALAPVVALLDTDRLARLNGEVVGGAEPEELAEELLDEVLPPPS
ncbi:MAG TPA: glycine betaine ABC transporter substrate-binding protein [Egibacteraceae bacterium]|jgi:osmoprotectant transport system substrate-binding protein|nr:glycine betaine ABC transporter substrate-binding protein [Egibacteraceae bacterium]